MSDDIDRVRELLGRQPDLNVEIPGTGRCVAADMEGDASGPVIVYIHGTPDSRLARHPDPSIVADLGLRLVSLDRPGFGRSTADPDATPTSFAADVAALLDYLEIPSAHLLTWSAGAIWTLGAASRLGARVRSVTAVGALVPFEAFQDPLVHDRAGSTRIGMIQTAQELGADLAAEMIAPLLVPDPMTPAAALEHRGESGDDALSSVADADIQMAAACYDAVHGGPAGLVRDVTVQFSDSGVDFTSIDAPTHLITGAEDTTCPPAFARWYARQIPGSDVEVIAGAGHGLLLTHWRTILTQILSR